tara:strand:+ start:819 stop:1007 length:189 start_codon:yes stop_codon:yes gene_type:complete
MSEGIFYPVLRELEDRKLTLQVHLAEGGAKTPEEYWRKVGEYTALIRLEGELKNLEQRYIAD